MKARKILSLALALGLSLSLAVPAAALTPDDAQVYLNKVKSAKGSSYLVDFDGDGREELVFTKDPGANGASKLVQVWQGDTMLGTMEDYYAGTMGDDDILFAARSGKHYLVKHSYMYRENSEEFDFYTVEKGKWVKKTTTKSKSSKYTWEDMKYTAKEHSVAAELEAAIAAVQPAAPTVAAGELPGYYGDRAGCKMTAEQANAFTAVLEAQMEQTKSQCAAFGFGSATCGAALVDFGNGVPALFFAGGHRSDGSANKTANKTSPLTGLADVAQSALWLYEGGKAVRLTAVDYQSVYLYPTYIYSEYDYGEGMNNVVFQAKDGAVSSAGGTELNSSAVRGNWLKGQSLCGFDQGGGVEGDYWGLTDAAQVLAGLKGYAAANPAMASASAQSVLVDGKAVEFQMYALKDENGGVTNYVKVRDIASVLNGTAAQFEVGYYSGMVHLVKGWSYTPNGSEMNTPFSGDQLYTKSAAQTNVDGVNLDLDAITLTDANGGGYTYYKLRDLGSALGFTVGWSAEKGIYIETQ